MGEGLSGAGRLEALESRIAPAVSTWTGAVSNLWSVAGNWNVAPTNGSDLVFPAGAQHLANVDDLPSTTGFGSLTIQASGYAISGTNSLSLSTAIDASQASGNSTISLPLSFALPGPGAIQAGSITVDHSAASLTVSSVIVEASALAKLGGGQLALTAANTYTGTTTVTGGVLQVDGSQPGSSIAVGTGTTLQGIGTVGAITSTSGTISPGDGGPGILTASGTVTFDSGSTFAPFIHSAVAGTGYSQLHASGQVTLANATLTPTITYTPTTNDQYTLIKNSVNTAINGIFNNLAQGADTTFSGQSYQITYVGNSAHDIVLTHLNTTTTTLKSSTATAVFGQSITLTATVTGVGSVSPSGTVNFLVGTNSVGSATLVAGVATLTTAALPVGTDAVTANYAGDSSNASSTSPPVTVTVAQASTTTGVTASPASPTVGTAANLTATVIPVSPGKGTASGSVQFFTGTTSLGSATLTNGSATLATAALPAGSNSVTAVYSGDTNFAKSTSSALTVNVLQASTTTMTSSTSAAVFGQPVTFQARVTGSVPGTPTGSVTFEVGTSTLGTATLSGGATTFSTSALPIGTDAVTAVYSGDTHFGTSTSSGVTVTVVQAGSSTTVTVAPNPSANGASVTLTATVKPASPSVGTPTGSVQFENGSTSLGTGTLSGNTATFTTTSLPVGTASIKAIYQGDTNFIGSTSPAVTATVVEASTTTTVTSSLTNPSAGQLDVLTATITASASSVTPTGTVTFFANGIMLGTATPSSGKATLSTYNLPVGAASVTAVYAGDNNTLGSTSPALAVSVGNLYEQYVNQVYIDVTGRPADTAGLEYWAGRLEQGTSLKKALNGIMRGTEAQNYLVQSTYVNLLGTHATKAQAKAALSQPNGSFVTLSAGILGSPPYFKTKGGDTISGYLDALARDVLASSLNSRQKSAITRQVAGGTTLVELATELLNSTPGKQQRVQTLFMKVLNRAAETAGQNFFVGLLNQGQKDGQVEIELLASEEFFSKFSDATP